MPPCISCGLPANFKNPNGVWVCKTCVDNQVAKEGYRLTNASRVKPEEVKWLVKGRIPLRGVTLLVGLGGLGKSTLALRITSSTTRGKAGREPADVIIATTEDSLSHTVVPRLMAAGADLKRVHFITITDSVDDPGRGLTLPEDIDKLRAAIETTGAELVVLDPVVGHMSAKIDSHNDHKVRQALGPLAKVADETGTAILGIGHLNKSQSTDILSRVNASVAFGNAARSVLFFTDDPNKEGEPDRLLIHAKSNLSQLAPGLRFVVKSASVEHEGRTWTVSTLDYIGEDDTISAGDALHGDRDELSQRELAGELILEVLEDGRKPWEQIKQALRSESVSDSTARRARTNLKKSGRIDREKDGMAGGWFWFKTDPGPTRGDRSDPQNGRSESADVIEVDHNLPTPQVEQLRENWATSGDELAQNDPNLTNLPTSGRQGSSGNFGDTENIHEDHFDRARAVLEAVDLLEAGE